MIYIHSIIMYLTRALKKGQDKYDEHDHVVLCFLSLSALMRRLVP